jgi:hypothetical protein
LVLAMGVWRLHRASICGQLITALSPRVTRRRRAHKRSPPSSNVIAHNELGLRTCTRNSSPPVVSQNGLVDCLTFVTVMQSTMNTDHAVGFRMRFRRVVRSVLSQETRARRWIADAGGCRGVLHEHQGDGDTRPGCCCGSLPARPANRGGADEVGPWSPHSSASHGRSTHSAACATGVAVAVQEMSIAQRMVRYSGIETRMPESVPSIHLSTTGPLDGP